MATNRTITLITTADPAHHAPDPPPDYERVVCSIDGDSYLEVSAGDATSATDPCTVEIREWTREGMRVACIRPTREGLVSLIETLQAELARMTRVPGEGK